MTTADFQQRHPKPWRFQMTKTGFSLRDANDITIGWLGLTSSHPGIPQNEWNRHMAGGLQEHIPVIERNDAVEMRKPVPHP